MKNTLSPFYAILRDIQVEVLFNEIVLDKRLFNR